MDRLTQQGSRVASSCGYSRPTTLDMGWTAGKEGRCGPKVKLLISKDTSNCYLPRRREPLGDRAQRKCLSVADEFDFPGGAQQGP